MPQSVPATRLHSVEKKNPCFGKFNTGQDLFFFVEKYKTRTDRSNWFEWKIFTYTCRMGRLQLKTEQNPKNSEESTAILRFRPPDRHRRTVTNEKMIPKRDRVLLLENFLLLDNNCLSILFDWVTSGWLVREKETNIDLPTTWCNSYKQKNKRR